MSSTPDPLYTVSVIDCTNGGAASRCWRKRLYRLLQRLAAADHLEYVHVRHQSGCEWDLPVSFRQMRNCHNEWSAIFEDLPPPPEVPTRWQRLKANLRTTTTHPCPREFLQEYLNKLLSRDEFVRSQEFQTFLRCQPPAALQSVEVIKSPCPKSADKWAVQLIMELPEHAEGIVAPVDEVVVSAMVGGHYKEYSFHLRPEEKRATRKIYELPKSMTYRGGIFEVRAVNGIGESESIVARILIESAESSTDEFGRGKRVRAVYSGDGRWYDALVTAVLEDDIILVQWLRPSPHGGNLVCVCTTGADDSVFTKVPRKLVTAVIDEDMRRDVDIVRLTRLAPKGMRF